MSATACTYSVDGEGPPLYLIHGLGSRRIAWAGLIPHIRDHFTCVRYDLKGHGDSPAPPAEYELKDMVADLEAIRTRLGHNKISIVGHALGGMIAAAYARAHSHRTRSLALLSIDAGRSDEDSTALKTIGDILETKGVNAIIGNLITRWYSDDFIAARPDLIAMAKKHVEQTPEDVFASGFRVYAGTEMGKWLRDVTCPSLVLSGAFDTACAPRHNRFMSDALPNAESVIVEGLKHSILIEGADRVAPPLVEFLLKYRVAD